MTTESTIQCPHDGEPCDGFRFCEICGAGPLVEGYCFEQDNSYRCARDSCEPKNLWIGDVYCADAEAAYDASEKQGGDICYYTEWERNEFCDCESGCPCWALTTSEYRIEVDVIVTRLYLVNAESPLEALNKYHAKQADRDESRSEMADWEEQENTARIAEAE